MILKPLFSNVLVEVESKKETTTSGLVIPENADLDAPQTGKVISVGPDVKCVKEGDTIVYKRFAPDEVKIDEQTHLLVSESDIIAIVRV